jgi:hypothetical protein
MPGPLYNVSAVAICPHGGQVQTISSNARVLAMGLPVATMADQFLVAGCAFALGTVPHPCVRVQWLVPAVRVLINGQPPILQTSTGLAVAADQAPQGPPAVIVTQLRVVAT